MNHNKFLEPLEELED